MKSLRETQDEGRIQSLNSPGYLYWYCVQQSTSSSTENVDSSSRTAIGKDSGRFGAMMSLGGSIHVSERDLEREAEKEEKDKDKGSKKGAVEKDKRPKTEILEDMPEPCFCILVVILSLSSWPLTLSFCMSSCMKSCMVVF